MFDSHVHTLFSTDSNLKIEDAIKAANNLNLNLTITEHIDYKYPVEGKFTFNPEEYFKTYNSYRGDRLLLGVEEGMRLDTLEENFNFLKGHPFDFVIGSIHMVGDKDIYYTATTDKRGKDLVYSEYLSYMLQCIKAYDFIDSLGHIDYISRYSEYDDNNIYYDDYKDLIDEILKTLIYKGIAIEINTRRLSDKDAVKSLMKIYKRYYELGGRYITIGSDAHRTNSIGMNFKEAIEVSDECGLIPVYYKERKPYFI